MCFLCVHADIAPFFSSLVWRCILLSLLKHYLYTEMWRAWARGSGTWSHARRSRCSSSAVTFRQGFFVRAHKHMQNKHSHIHHISPLHTHTHKHTQTHYTRARTHKHTAHTHALTHTCVFLCTYIIVLTHNLQKRDTELIEQLTSPWRRALSQHDLLRAGAHCCLCNQ